MSNHLDQLDHEDDPIAPVAGWPADIPWTAAPVLPLPASPPVVVDVDQELEETPAPRVEGVGLLSSLFTLREPVRTRLYAVLVAVLALLVYRGLVDGSEAALWGALGAAVLGIPVVESVRGSVYSPRSYIRDTVTAARTGEVPAP